MGAKSIDKFVFCQTVKLWLKHLASRRSSKLV